MKSQFLLRGCLVLIVLHISSFAVADVSEQGPVDELVIAPDKVYVPDTCISQLNKKFAFDWSDYATIPTGVAKIAAIEGLLNQTKNYSTLNSTDKIALVTLLNKLGAYYAFISHDPDMGITKLNQATTMNMFAKKNDIAWNNNLLSYTYEQKYATAGQANDKNKALSYVNTVITKLYPNQKNNAVAFAYSIQGLIQSDDANYADADASYQKALTIYAKNAAKESDQYILTKEAMANNLLQQQGHENAAITQFQDINHYWESKQHVAQNSYAANNLMSLGQAYLQVNNPKAALDTLNSALKIYTLVYGENNHLLVTPYELLADTYYQLNDDKQVAYYLQKADQADK